MAKFVPALDIHAIAPEDRQRLQIGQWVYASDPSAKGRFYGSTGAHDVVAWLGNARAWRRKQGGMPAYFRTIRDYGRSLTRRLPCAPQCQNL
ncbi:hypothetical protein GOC13_07355 [Sinorhizobium meliloti]|nr:hypothetical protein [Sinorhizobium meliloti]